MPKKTTSTSAKTTRSVQAAARRAIFCEAYIANGGNGKAAAIAAGYKPSAAESLASRMLVNPEVKKVLDARRAALARKYELQADDVIAELSMLTYLDPAECFAEDGSLLPVRNMPVHVRKAISSIEVEELFEGVGKNRKQVGWTKKIKFWDKNSALEKAMKNLGQFSKDNEQTRPTVRIIDLTGTPTAST